MGDNNEQPMLGEIAVDMTELFRAEWALKETLEQMHTLIESIPDVIVLKDGHGRWLLANKAALRLFDMEGLSYEGKTREELAAIRPKYCTALEGCRQSEEQAWEQGGISASEERVSKPDGSTVILETIKAPLFHAHGGRKGLIIVGRDITARKTAEEELAAYQEQLKSLAEELCQAEERERRRIAAELHDQLGQTLAFAKIKFNALTGLAAQAEHDRTFAEISEALDRSIQEVRSLTFQLSPPLLYEVGLEAALESLAEHFQEEHDFLVEFLDDGRPKPLSREAQITMFQMVREAMVNIAKHAKAKRVKIAITAADSIVSITIEDDGTGFDMTSAMGRRGSQRGFGLFNIQRRMEHLGGELAIDSEIGRGARILLRAPLSG